MKNIIDQIEITTTKYLSDVGFEMEQIESLITKGKRDLTKVLQNLKNTLDETPMSIDDLDHSLHALKGLLFQLGNNELAEKVNDARSYSGDKTVISELKKLLFLSSTQDISV